MNNDPKLVLAEYLKSGKTHMMQIASSTDSQPWICTVYYAVDDDLNLYWASTSKRRHSQELASNSNAAIAIAHDQQPPTKTHQGVQAEGTVMILEGDAKKAAADLYAAQLSSSPEWIAAIKADTDPHQIYKFCARRFVLFDDVNFSGAEAFQVIES